MKTKILGLIALMAILSPLLLTTAFAANITDDSACTAIGGSCMDKSQCTSGTPQSGKCPGASNIQCCVPNSIKSANSTGATSVTLPNPLGATSISDLINNIVTYLIEIATIILPIVLIYAAYLLMTAGGEMDRVIMGRKTITYAIIGYALILISKGVTMIVANIMGAK
jgi:hypothetical protein